MQRYYTSVKCRNYEKNVKVPPRRHSLFVVIRAWYRWRCQSWLGLQVSAWKESGDDCVRRVRVTDRMLRRWRTWWRHVRETNDIDQKVIELDPMQHSGKRLRKISECLKPNTDTLSLVSIAFDFLSIEVIGCFVLCTEWRVRWFDQWLSATENITRWWSQTSREQTEQQLLEQQPTTQPILSAYFPATRTCCSTEHHEP